MARCWHTSQQVARKWEEHYREPGEVALASHPLRLPLLVGLGERDKSLPGDLAGTALAALRVVLIRWPVIHKYLFMFFGGPFCLLS